MALEHQKNYLKKSWKKSRHNIFSKTCRKTIDKIYSENSREKYLDKIETADIIETVMMNQKRVYLYKESVEKTSRIVELDRERRRRKSLK